MQAQVMGWMERIGRIAPTVRLALGPHAGDLRLDRRRVYILPSRAGLLFGLALVTMLLTAVNYALALGYGLTFLLAGVGLVSMLHTWRNLVGLTLRAGRAEPVHAGELAELSLIVQNPRGPERFAIELTVPGTAQPTRIDVSPATEQLVTVALPTERRGWQSLPRLRLSTTFPLGLWRAWAWWHPQARILVLPRLETPASPMPESGAAGTERAGRGEEDFAAIRPFREGDSPRRLAWKAMARSGGDALLVREFEGGSGGQLLLDWQSLPPGLDPELRLSRLARWIVDAEAAGLSYGLRLPGVALELDAGPAHRAACLEALAVAQV
ncbi:MAG: DUF58 domain-containing protein [Burkholderiales bacterium]|nr:MAG: DUF58 domain-containing protein [Burkholderiales bacterium]